MVWSLAATPSMQRAPDGSFSRGPTQVYGSIADTLSGMGSMIAGGFLVASNPFVGGALLAFGGYELAAGIQERLKLGILSSKYGLANERITMIHKPTHEWKAEVQQNLCSKAK